MSHQPFSREQDFIINLIQLPNALPLFFIDNVKAALELSTVPSTYSPYRDSTQHMPDCPLQIRHSCIVTELENKRLSPLGLRPDGSHSLGPGRIAFRSSLARYFLLIPISIMILERQYSLIVEHRIVIDMQPH